MVVNVRDSRPIVYHPTPIHNHRPCKEPDEWNKVCEDAAKDDQLGFWLTRFARNKVSPPTVASAARVELAFN
jgi:hypothetical protein